MPEIVLQKLSRKGRYCGPLLHGRYQVLEGILKGQFFIADCQSGGEALIDKTAKNDGSIRPLLYFDSRSWAEAYVDQLVSGKAAPKPAKSVATDPSVKAKAPAGRSMSGEVRRLIEEGKLTDKQIFDQVVKEFPTLRESTVPWMRKKMA